LWFVRFELQLVRFVVGYLKRTGFLCRGSGLTHWRDPHACIPDEKPTIVNVVMLKKLREHFAMTAGFLMSLRTIAAFA
jgi:hypothetical protein